MRFLFFVVGATAYDILLQHAHDIPSTRATIDLDIGVSVSDWNRFQALKDALVNSGLFKASRETQRLLYKDSFPVDMIPFGKISSDDGSISWPPEHDFEMSIVGFQDCYQYAISVLIRESPDLFIKVVSLAGLAILKIVSWDDNAERRGKDAVDLYLIIRNYIEAGNMDRFFEKVSVHRAPHLLCSRALEVQLVRLRTRRRTSAAPCKRLSTEETPSFGCLYPVNGYLKRIVISFKKKHQIMT